MDGPQKQISVKFFQQESGREPVRDWLLSMPDADCDAIGFALQRIELGWPLGMPLARSIVGHKGLWEARCDLDGGRIARVFFMIDGGDMVLLHGFEKKSQKTPDHELAVAVKRMKGHKNDG
jgi:phage-related protein